MQFSNEGLEGLVRDYTDSELLRMRVSLIRQISRLNDFLGIVDFERSSRCPADQEADVLPFQRNLQTNAIEQ